MKLLVVEDEIKTANSLKKGLEENGYQVDVANDGLSAQVLIQKKKYDLILLDIIIPKINGLELSKSIRIKNSEVPIIMLTALGLTSDKLKGFASGADDYLAKPFDFEELLARIKVALNRSNKIENVHTELVYSNLSMNTETKEVKREKSLLNLTAKEYALLEYFLRNKHKVISKEEIAEKVWGINFDTGTNIIEVYVSYLRNKVDKGFESKLIHTKKGMGYILKEEI